MIRTTVLLRCTLYLQRQNNKLHEEVPGTAKLGEDLMVRQYRTR